MAEPIEITQLKQRDADARRAFASDVDGLLTELHHYSESLGDAIIGPQSRAEAYQALRRFVLEKFAQRLHLRSDALTAEPLLLQLVREAYDLLLNPETPLDVRDWRRAADPYIVPRLRFPRAPRGVLPRDPIDPRD
jgi:hypothetical protein